MAQACSVARQSSARTVHATSLHHSNLDTRHPLSSGTDTHVDPRFQSRHPAPRPRWTSSLLPAAHNDLLKKEEEEVGILHRALQSLGQCETPRENTWMRKSHKMQISWAFWLGGSQITLDDSNTVLLFSSCALK